MSKRDLEADLKLCEAAPEIRPYATRKGGVVVINGPFPIDKALACVAFLEQAREALPYYIAEVKRLRGALEAIARGLRDAAEDAPKVDIATVLRRLASRVDEEAALEEGEHD